MNLGLFRKENLQSGDAKMVGDAVVDQFQRTHGALTAWQENEHTDDGSHTDIHADSITVDGDVVVGGGIEAGDGGFTGEGGNVAIGELPIGQVPGQGPQPGGYGIKIGPWRIVSDASTSPGTPTYPSLAFQFLNEVIGPYLFRFLRAAANDWVLAPAAGVLLRLGRAAPGERIASIDTSTLGVLGTATIGTANITGNAVVTGDVNMNVGFAQAYYAVQWIRATGWFYEEGRGVPLGHWRDADYIAGNYITVTGLPWTVPAANWKYRYCLIGKTIHIYFNFVATSVPAGAAWGLAVVLPAGLTFSAAQISCNLARPGYISNNGVLATGYITTWQANYWAIVVDSGLWNPSAGGTTIYGAFTAEIA